MGVGFVLLIILVILLTPFVLLKIYLVCITRWCKSYVCLAGKTAIITGANSGIGYMTALEMAKRGCRIVMACRNLTTAVTARDKIVKLTKNENVVVMKIDLASFESVRNFVADFCQNEARLDILINNAGAVALGKKTTDDGYDMTTQVNYLSPVLLTHLLLGKLKASAPSRIVNVTSQAAAYTVFDIDKLNAYPTSIFPGVFAYSNSKLCNIFHTIMLAEELQGTGITINAVHPGAVRTEVINTIPKPGRYFMKIGSLLLYKTPECGAQTTIYAAIAQEVDNVTGKIFEECKQVKMYRTANNRELCEQVWLKTRTMLKI